jgi:hypothetical protein
VHPSLSFLTAVSFKSDIKIKNTRNKVLFERREDGEEEEEEEEEGMLVSFSNTTTGVKKTIIIATTTPGRRRGIFWTRRSARVAASFEDKYIYKNRDGKETERDGLAISPFAGGDKRRARRVFEIELPSRDIGIEFREAKGCRFTAMVSKVERTSRAFGKVKEGDVLTRVTATQIHEKVPETQPTTILDPTGWKYTTGWFECKDESFDDVIAAIRSTAVVSVGFVHKSILMEFLRFEDEKEEQKEGEEEKKAHHDRDNNDKTYRQTLAQRGKLEADRESKRVANVPKDEIEGGFAKDEDSEKLFKEDPPGWDD